jgi:hypothetical protein
MISEREYTIRRLANKGNDKGNREKLLDDAKLRGALGTKKANRLIRALDTYKTGCSSFNRFGNIKD